jgi:Uncharacterised nucleotidyltransferase
MTKMAEQMAEALSAFAECSTEPALIGGLALAAHNYVRATQDIDFLVDADDADRLHKALVDLGYRCLHRSADAATYVRGDEGLDFLYAHRPISRALLTDAITRETTLGRLRIVSAEGMIGFKLQAFVNDAMRMRDIDDIRHLLRNNRDTLNMKQVRGYFALFQREDLLDELLADAK